MNEIQKYIMKLSQVNSKIYMLPCSCSDTKTQHVYNGPLLGKNDRENPKYEKFKNKHSFTCLKCGTTRSFVITDADHIKPSTISP